MNLWSFGDSFSVDLNRHYQSRTSSNYVVLDNNWQTHLCELLNISELQVFATWGASNDWTWNNIMKTADNFEAGDVVIIQSTAFNRLWLLNDRPEYSNFMLAPIDKEHISKNQTKSIEMFKRHLYHEQMFYTLHNMFSHACYNLGKILPHVKLLILPGFHTMPGVTGCLMDICNNEFESDSTEDKFYKYHPFDYRVNHMHEKNHLILAEKIAGFFEGNTLDLTTGFYSNYITEKNYKLTLDS